MTNTTLYQCILGSTLLQARHYFRADSTSRANLRASTTFVLDTTQQLSRAASFFFWLSIGAAQSAGSRGQALSSSFFLGLGAT